MMMKQDHGAKGGRTTIWGAYKAAGAGRFDVGVDGSGS